MCRWFDSSSGHSFLDVMLAPEVCVYVGIGGNVGDVVETIHTALTNLDNHSAIVLDSCSSLFTTTPVSTLPQPLFINAVCRLSTALSAMALLRQLQRIEASLGKVPKPKEAPRTIDLDILFYGPERYNQSELIIPHPHWQQRLFVLVPLRQLTPSVSVWNDSYTHLETHHLDDLLQRFDNSYGEVVTPYKEI